MLIRINIFYANSLPVRRACDKQKNKNIHMKQLLYICCMLLVFTGCEVDNYDGPNAQVNGKIIDSQTGELVPSGGSVAGTIVRFFQNNSTQPLNYTTFPDGTFTNKATFTGDYTYMAEGAFQPVNSAPQSITVTRQTEVEIPVIPHIRLGLSQVSVSGDKAVFKVEYNKLATDQAFIELGISWADYPNPNRIVYRGGTTLLEDVSALGYTTGDKEYELTGLLSGKTYFIRAYARTNNPGAFYNYSHQLELRVP